MDRRGTHFSVFDELRAVQPTRGNLPASGLRALAGRLDVLMPPVATCAACHAGNGASSRGAERHGGHAWTRARAVTPRITLDEFC